MVEGLGFRVGGAEERAARSAQAYIGYILNTKPQGFGVWGA